MDAKKVLSGHRREVTGDLEGNLDYLGKAFIFVSSAKVLEENGRLSKAKARSPPEKI